MDLSDWVYQAGVSKHAAYRWYRAGTLPVPARRAGRLILVEPAPPAAHGRTVVCARVSSAGQRAGFDRQVASLGSWVAAKGLTVGEVVTAVGSAVNGRRRKLGRQIVVPIVVGLSHTQSYAGAGGELNVRP